MKNEIQDKYRPSFTMRVEGKMWYFLETDQVFPDERVWGLAWKNEKVVALHKDLRKQSRFLRVEILLHETIHLFCPEMSEIRVKNMARVLARVLRLARL